MKKLDRFILKSFVGPFVAILFIVVFILAMQTLWLYIDELVGKGLGIRTILEFLFWGVCSLALPLALPLATLLAATMTIGQLSERTELMAIRASGISFGRIIVPIAVAAAFIACGTFVVCSRLVPHAFNLCGQQRAGRLRQNAPQIPALLQRGHPDGPPGRPLHCLRPLRIALPAEHPHPGPAPTYRQVHRIPEAGDPVTIPTDNSVRWRRGGRSRNWFSGRP